MQENIESSEKTVSIYALFDPREPEHVRYVGKTVKKLHSRLKDHITQSRKEQYTTHKCNWIRKLLAEGVEPCIRVIEVVSESNWQQHEISQIALHKEMMHNLTNSTLGGEGVVVTEELRAKMCASQKGKVVSEATRQKIREANLGKKHSDETKAKQRERMLGNTHTLGYCPSEATRQKHREIMLARVPYAHTPESKKKISETSKGRKHSDATRQKISEIFKGHEVSPETRLKISEAKKAKFEERKELALKEKEQEALYFASIEEGFSVWL